MLCIKQLAIGKYRKRIRNHRSLNFRQPGVTSTKRSVGSETSTYIWKSCIGNDTNIWHWKKSHWSCCCFDISLDSSVLSLVWDFSFHVSHVSFFSDGFFKVIFWQCQLSVIVLALRWGVSGGGTRSDTVTGHRISKAAIIIIIIIINTLIKESISLRLFHLLFGEILYPVVWMGMTQPRI